MLRFVFFIAQCAAIVAVAMAGRAEPLRIEIRPAVAQVEIDPSELYCMTEALYWEGRNQDGVSIAAIGNVILNRAANEDFPDSVCDVVHQGPLDGSKMTLHRCQFSYYCDGKSDKPSDNILEQRAWAFSEIIAELLLRGEVQDFTHGSTYYHADYVDPFWNKVYTEVAQLGDHKFYVHN